jgi:hypothetical protein
MRGAVNPAASGLALLVVTQPIPPIKTAPTAAGASPLRLPVVTPTERTIAAASTAASAEMGVDSRRS